MAAASPAVGDGDSGVAVGMCFWFGVDVPVGTTAAVNSAVDSGVAVAVTVAIGVTVACGGDTGDGSRTGVAPAWTSVVAITDGIPVAVGAGCEQASMTTKSQQRVRTVICDTERRAI